MISGVMHEPVNVLAVTLSMRPVGTDHSLRNLVRAFGADVQVTLAGPADSELEQWWRDSGLSFLGLPTPRHVGLTDASGNRIRSVGDISREVAQVCKFTTLLARVASDYDVIHSNWLFSHIDAALSGRLTRIPTVLELHDILPFGPGRKALDVAVGLSGRAVAVSNAVREQLGEAARQRTVTILQGVDTSRFSPGEPDPEVRQSLTDGDTDCFLVGVVGRLDPCKGLVTAIDAVAMARMLGVNARLVLVGAPSEDDGSYEKLLRSRAARYLPGAHTFVKPTEDVVSVLQSIDVLAVPSVDEPFGLVAAESQSCGTPVIVSDSGGLPEFVLDGRTGLVIQTGDAFAMCDALRTLHDDRALYASMVTAGREHMVNGFDIRLRAESMESMYRRALAER